MNAVTDVKPAAPVVSAPFFARGVLIEGQDAIHRSRDLGVTFATPKIDLNRVVHSRTETPALLNVPLAATHILPRSVVESTAKHAVSYLDKKF